MGKLEQFKAHCAQHGQSITLYPFVANPSGTYLDTPSGYPDPESGGYPGAVPSVTYNTAVSLKGFVQPMVLKEQGGTMYVKGQHGEDVRIDLYAYIPGDQAVTVRDKLVIGGVNYEVMFIREWADGATVVFRRLDLEKMQA